MISETYNWRTFLVRALPLTNMRNVLYDHNFLRVTVVNAPEIRENCPFQF